MAAKHDSNGLLKFMTNATSSIQEAMGRQAKSKKVNHRKYLEKRLQGGSKKSKRPKAPTTAVSSLFNRQPVAMPAQPTNAPQSSSGSYFSSSENEYDQLFKLVSPPPPSIFPRPAPPPPVRQQQIPNLANGYCSPPVSNDYQQQQEIETILSELEAENPLQSLYADSGSLRGPIESVTCSSTSLSMENTLVSFNDSFVFSPSNVSDFDESAYSSPGNPSPMAYHSSSSSSNTSPPTPEMYHHHHHHSLTATYDCIPTTTGSEFAPIPPNELSLGSYSINDLLELVSTP